MGRVVFNRSWTSLCVAEQHKALDGEISLLHGPAQAHGPVGVTWLIEIKSISMIFRIRIMLESLLASYASHLAETYGRGQCKMLVTKKTHMKTFAQVGSSLDRPYRGRGLDFNASMLDEATYTVVRSCYFCLAKAQHASIRFS